MSQEGEEMADDQRWVVYAHAAGTEKGVETAGLRRKDLAAQGCIQWGPSHPACRWANAGYMRRREW
jgi:hypothetical protein